MIKVNHLRLETHPPNFNNPNVKSPRCNTMHDLPRVDNRSGPRMNEHLPNDQPDSKLPTHLPIFRFVKSDDIHVPRAVVDTKQVGMREAAMIDVVGAVNSRNSATGASSGTVLTEFLGPDQLTFRSITAAIRSAFLLGRNLTATYQYVTRSVLKPGHGPGSIPAIGTELACP